MSKVFVISSAHEEEYRDQVNRWFKNNGTAIIESFHQSVAVSVGSINYHEPKRYLVLVATIIYRDSEKNGGGDE